MTLQKNNRVNSRLLSRLQSDLKELTTNPYEGVDVYHHSDNLQKFCLVLTPLDGPFLGLRLHFEVNLPGTWPIDPPQISSTTDLDHPNVFGGYVCSDLLRLYNEIPEEGYTGGYTPAFTLGGLFTQFLSFFSSEEVEQEGGTKVRIGNRFEERYYSAEVLKSSYWLNLLYNGSTPLPEARDHYLREVEAGGNTESVYARYNVKGAQYYLSVDYTVTVWRPSSGGESKFIKATWVNPRYLGTKQKVERVQCSNCGCGTPSMPCSIPIQAPSGITSDAVSWVEIEKARRAFEDKKSMDERKLRNLKKKLREIILLKERQSTGETLQANQISKISTQSKIATEIEELEAKITNQNSTKIPEVQITSVNSFKPKTEEHETLGVGINAAKVSHNNRVCHLNILNDDVLLMIAASLPSESLINFGKAYHRLHALVTEHHVLLQRELKCFFLRTPLNNPTNLLGVGVNIDNMGGLESSFDWLSMDAFELFKVRKSIDKKEFKFFLPLGFSTSHFERAYDSGKLFEYIDKITAAIPTKRRATSENGAFVLNAAERRIQVLYKFCNSIIVSLMRTTDDLYSGSSSEGNAGSSKTLLFASEKACIGYLQIYHLLLCIMRREPKLRDRALARLRAFCSTDANRAKSSVPDLGEFLVMAAVVAGSHKSVKEDAESHSKHTMEAPSVYSEESEEDGWILAGQKKKGKKLKLIEKEESLRGGTISWREHLVGPFTNEVLTRNVRWVIQKHPSLAIINGPSPQLRMRTTFNESRTSLRLVMFQVFFLETFTADHITRQMASQYGFAGPEVPTMITKGIKEIYSIDRWELFFGRVGFGRAVPSKPLRVNKMLEDAVTRSAHRGYHRDPRSSGGYQGSRRGKGF